METINYKVGAIVELIDGVQYVYRGMNPKEGYYVYDPVRPNRSSIFLDLSDEDCVKYGYNIGAVAFTWKKRVNVKLIKRV